MKRIYIPTSGAEDWRGLLADPVKQWRIGCSAHALAYAWENARGFPVEIQELITNSDSPCHEVELLFAIPEYKVALPPYSGHPSQNDLFAIARNFDHSLIAITVEAKVAESFGQTLSEWNAASSPGKTTRLAYIKEKLGLTDELSPGIRYQLLHRTASAMIEAERFTAKSAMMIVHSFSQNDAWFEDYQAFINLYDAKHIQPGRLYFLREISGIRLYSGWARGVIAERAPDETTS